MPRRARAPILDPATAAPRKRAGDAPRRGGRPPSDPALVDLAVEMVVEHGISRGEAARTLDVSPATIAGWLRARGVTSRVELTPEIAERARGHMTPDEAPPEEPADDGVEPGDDLEAFLSRLMRDSRQTSEQARRQGNFTAAQRSARDAAALAPVLARLQKSKAELGDAVVVSRSKIGEVIESYRAKARIALERPLLCAHCHRELMAAWGGEAVSQADAAARQAKG